MDRPHTGLIGRVYDAAVRPELWQAWFEDLCRAVRAPAAAFVLRFEPGAGFSGHFAVGIRHELGARYLNHLAADHRIFKPLYDLVPGDFVNLSEAVSDAEFQGSRFFTEWMTPQGFRHLLVGMVHKTAAHVTGFGFLRRQGVRPFGEPEINFLQRLAPHIQRAIHVQELVAAADLKAHTLTTTLEVLRVGAVLVDIDGAILHADGRAEALLERRENLCLKRGQLWAEESEDAAALKRLVSEAIGAAGESQARGAGVIALSQPGETAPLVAFVTRIRSTPGGTPWLKGRVALVLLSDPSELPLLSAEALRHLYGLTPAEVLVAERIAHGSSVGETAAALDVSVSTIRTQLQRVFAKTSTRRQAELVRLLLTGAGAPAGCGKTADLFAAQGVPTSHTRPK